VEQAKVNPNSPKAYINLGTPAINKADMDMAIADCNKAIEINPKYLEAYGVRARIYMMSEDFDKARKDVDKVKELGGEVNPEILEELKNASGKKEKEEKQK
jgi:Tfp pilus assembly protein PilF